ncbi:MAG: cyclase family protein [Frankiales bacterium]|nr:cyclase family protein [Frankiales bacterium]
MSETTTQSNESQWLLDLAANPPFGPEDRLGTANYLSPHARLRGAQSISAGAVVSLARPLVDSPSARRDGRPSMSVEVFVTGSEVSAMGSDHVELDCHGLQNTHLDALNHVGVGGHWYGGFALDDPSSSSVADLAGAGLFTRAVLVDIPTLRGTPWAEGDQPVTGSEIDQALAQSGVEFESGDALLLYLGRDRYEAAGHVYDMSPGSPGLGESGVQWVAEHQVSILCWDFLDEPKTKTPVSTGHSLIWAIGLLLVDSCDFAALNAAMGAGGGVAGALVLAPLALPGATGCNVNPLVLR